MSNLKLARVPISIDGIQTCVDTYSARHTPQLIAKSQRKATLDISVPAPVDIAILAGEALYQLRSTLDHLAFDLVKLNPGGISLPRDWEENCQFPIVTRSLKPTESADMPYGFFGNLPGITVKAHTIINSLQPYYATGKVNNCLRFLKKLSNIDKHRHLALTKMRFHVTEYRSMISGVTSSASVILDHGAEVDLLSPEESSDPTVEVDYTVSTFVAFDEPIIRINCHISPSAEI